MDVQQKEFELLTHPTSVVNIYLESENCLGKMIDLEGYAPLMIKHERLARIMAISISCYFMLFLETHLDSYFVGSFLVWMGHDRQKLQAYNCGQLLALVGVGYPKTPETFLSSTTEIFLTPELSWTAHLLFPCASRTPQAHVIRQNPTTSIVETSIVIGVGEGSGRQQGSNLHSWYISKDAPKGKCAMGENRVTVTTLPQKLMMNTQK